MFVNSSSNDFKTLPPSKDMGEFIVAGSSSSEEFMGLEDSQEESKIQLENN